MLYKQIDVEVATGIEKQVAILESTTAEPVRIVAVSCEILAELDLLVNVERERLVDIPTDASTLTYDWLPIGIDVPSGRQVQVGFRNATGSTQTKYIVIQYEITA